MRNFANFDTPFCHSERSPRSEESRHNFHRTQSDVSSTEPGKLTVLTEY